MRNRKLFVGRRIRELREANRLTQAGFAERLGLSTSYLNQIENNQRPVSAAVLLALAESFQVDIADLSSGEDERLISALAEALSDPIFETYSPSLQEMKLITHNAPGLAHALITCHQAYRRNSEQLASLDDTLGRGAGLAERTPYEEVRDFFHFVDNHIDELDRAAEALAGELGIPEREQAKVPLVTLAVLLALMLQAQVQRWLPWVDYLMLLWFEVRWQQSGDVEFLRWGAALRRQFCLSSSEF